MSDLSSILENLSAYITYDGTKIKQGLTDDSCDVNILGFKNVETLEERTGKLEEDVRELNSLHFQIDELQSNKTNIHSL